MPSWVVPQGDSKLWGWVWMLPLCPRPLGAAGEKQGQECGWESVRLALAFELSYPVLCDLCKSQNLSGPCLLVCKMIPYRVAAKHE